MFMLVKKLNIDHAREQWPWLSEYECQYIFIIIIPHVMFYYKVYY